MSAGASATCSAMRGCSASGLPGASPPSSPARSRPPSRSCLPPGWPRASARRWCSPSARRWRRPIFPSRRAHGCSAPTRCCSRSAAPSAPRSAACWWTRWAGPACSGSALRSRWRPCCCSARRPRPPQAEARPVSTRWARRCWSSRSAACCSASTGRQAAAGSVQHCCWPRSPLAPGSRSAATLRPSSVWPPSAGRASPFRRPAISPSISSASRSCCSCPSGSTGLPGWTC